MWIMLNDAFLSIVQKDGAEGELLVRARRSEDILRVFGRRVRVTRTTDADYLYRAIVSREDVKRAMGNEVDRITYPNFKSSVKEDDLHKAYMRVWSAMAEVQNPRPYSERYLGVGKQGKKAKKAAARAEKKAEDSVAQQSIDKALADSFDAWPWPRGHWFNKERVQ
jgi:hypothetical protein